VTVLQPIIYLIRKEFRQVFRTREMIMMLFIMPIIQTLILGFAITSEVKHLKLLVVDLDDSRTSRELVRRFTRNDRFDVVGYSPDVRAVAEDIRKWRAQAGLVIPRGFEQDWKNGLKPQVGLAMDAIDGNTAGVAAAYAQQILAGFAATLVPAGTPNPWAVEDRMWYNPGLVNAQFMIPGLVVIIVTMVSMMMSSMALVKEKEIGTLEQLMVTPITKLQLLIGKLFPFLALTFVELAVSLTAGQLLFGIRMNGSYLLLAGLALLYLFTTLGIGLLVSTLTQTQQQAMFFSWFFMVFMILLSGLFIPIENMPPVIGKITLLNPMRYFVAIMREIFQKADTLTHMWRDVLPMTAYGMTIFTVAVVAFRKRVR
jgi:ABC-2 type transport system permease protein